MDGKIMKIGVVAPSSRLEPEVAEKLVGCAATLFPGRVEIHVHPQCFLSHGHFAGDDAARAEAFVEVANDASCDALWFARGGYGSCRILDLALPHLGEAARAKTYLGYSDAGSVLGALYGAGFPNIAHGPMPIDLIRSGGEAAVARALAYLVDRDPSAVEASVGGARKLAAFNLNILSHLVGTPHQPDLTDHVVMVEEVSEYMYQIDRSFFHITNNPGVRSIAGLMLGRCGDIPENDRKFGADEDDVARFWCEKADIAYLGRADIGHDAHNKVVPFGAAQPTSS